MRYITIIPSILFSAAFVLGGVVMFVVISQSQQKYITELHCIHAGKVQPETLTVVTKHLEHSYSSHSGHTSKPIVVCSSQRTNRIYLSLSLKNYTAISAGDTVTGYYFPDGYLVPAWHGNDAGLARWIFLGFGIFLGMFPFIGLRKRQRTA
jgi:hypothetical protein